MRSLRQPSLRWRIFGLAAVMLAASAALLMLFIHDYARQSSDRAFDRLLSASALSIAGAVLVEDGAVALELPSAAFDMVSGGERIFYAVIGPLGRHVTGYDDLAPDLPLATATDPVFADVRYNGEAVRIASVGRLISTEAGTGWVTIRVAETRGARAALAAEIFGNAVLPVGVLMLLALGTVWVVVGRAFAPLAVIDRILRERRHDDMSPVEAPVPVEVQRLVEGLNSFMARLRASSERLGELVAEAAHQVRNPLASLRAQSELALSEPDDARLRERVSRIHDRAVEASHLASQLLMDATISHRMDANEDQPVSVSVLVDEVVGRLDPDARHRVSVHLGRGTETAVLRGDRVGLREMLRNLIGNALSYTDGPISIVLDSVAAGTIRIAVLDRGPGIGDDEKPRVLERFVRGGGAGDRVGSGLGLAIVKRVVEGHGGRLDLADRPGGGLAVHVHLPAEGLGDGLRPVAGLAPAVALAGALLAGIAPAEAQESFYPAPEAETRRLVIAGTTDTGLFADFIAAFQTLYPSVAVAYTEIDSLGLYVGLLSGAFSPVPDLLISSASDLQIKLANDGHALTHRTPAVDALPDWAQWRGEVIGFTYEPAVIVYNPMLVPPGTQPRTHRDLAELLESDPTRFTGRVATYDIARSGLGYLLAAQDQQISSQFWRLVSVMGRVRAVLSDSSSQILEWVAAGDVAIAYNVLGSYAFARQAEGAPVGIVVPDDYVLVLTRSMLIPRAAPNPDLARSFVDFTLSPLGQSVASGRSALGAIMPDSPGNWTAERISAMGQGAIQPIRLAPVLLVALDPLRRSRFLATWKEIVAPGLP
jgi:two-component system, OmpR family, sensor histidine kinase TctE